MKTLVTGATGLVGHRIASELLKRGDEVRALVRDVERARKLLPSAVELMQGDVTIPSSLPAVVAGRELVFHAAGLTEQWQPDESIFDRVNRKGTADLLAAAMDAHVRRVVYTSTMDVFAAPRGGTVVEDRRATEPKGTAYERSKVAAEREVERAVAQGLDVVLINPAAVYGPGPVVGGLNTAFVKLARKQVPALIPGGAAVAYVDGVAAAHLVAAERGKTGERYLVGDTYVSLRELAETTARIARLPSLPSEAPEWLIRSAASALAPLARIFAFTPPLSPGELYFFLWEARVDASKARRELGFQPMPFEEGVKRTFEHFWATGVLLRPFAS